MTYDDPTLRHMLAAEYVLGTLRGRARARFERLLGEDASLKQVLAYWEDRLGQLGLDLTPVEPPDSVWQAIERQVGRVPAAERPVHRPVRPPRTRWWRRAGVWQGWAALATAASIAFAVMLWAVPAFNPGGYGAHATYASVMHSQKGHAEWLVMLYPGRKSMRVKTVSAYKTPQGHSLELWVLPGGHEKPVALGVIPASGSGLVSLSAAAQAAIGQKSKLAVSLEPAGGSPTGQPTGPVLSSAQVLVVD